MVALLLTLSSGARKRTSLGGLPLAPVLETPSSWGVGVSNTPLKCKS